MTRSPRDRARPSLVVGRSGRTRRPPARQALRRDRRGWRASWTCLDRAPGCSQAWDEFTGDWGLGTGDWGLGIGDWGLGSICHAMNGRELVVAIFPAAE